MPRNILVVEARGILLLLTVMLVAGCGDGRPERVPVSGKVLIDGKPATSGSVQFLPHSGGRPSAGGIQPDGSFSLFTYEQNDGCRLGTYDVVVSSIEEVGETKVRYNLPKKYGNPKTSGITKAIDGPMDDLVFELTWGGAPGPVIENVQ
jgi:hypothetical protein